MLLCLHTNLSKKYMERLERYIQRRRITDRENKQKKELTKGYYGYKGKEGRKVSSKKEKEKRKKRDVN